MKDFKKLQEMDRRMRELAGLYAAEKERADKLEAELRSFVKIREHYEHAKEKRPYFCDILTRLRPSGYVFNLTKQNLETIHTDLCSQNRCGVVDAMTVLNCVERKIEYSIVRNENRDAVEECYDAIAVLLRVVDVLEGRQALGDPAKKEGAK